MFKIFIQENGRFFAIYSKKAFVLHSKISLIDY